MSGFLSEKYGSLEPYTPGEQPKNGINYVKLNTNESPYPPSPHAVSYASAAVSGTRLYCDPECTELRRAASCYYGVTADCIVCGNGSDDILNFAFAAFCDDKTPAVFADITYGFYRVFADYNRVPYKVIPLKDDLSLDVGDYENCGGTVFIANPNAPTGMTVDIGSIERLLQKNKDNVVVIDEAYVDFGGESCVPLTEKYKNLLVTQTFSKSRSLAGARLGFGIGDRALIADCNTVRFSTNPYNVNSITQAAGIGALEDRQYTEQNCEKIMITREKTVKRLEKLGFICTDSHANFIFARHKTANGKTLYEKLKENGVLVRRFDQPRIRDHLRITVGDERQMDILIGKLEAVLTEVENEIR